MFAKPFNLSDVLTIVTGRLVSLRGMEGVYDILRHLTGDDIYTNVIPRAIEACRSVLLADHPWLEEEAKKLNQVLDNLPKEVDKSEDIKLFFADLMCRVGSSDINVMPLSPEQWLVIDPVEEAKAMFGDDNVIVIE